MSSRNMRKLFGTTTLPPPDENSDDDFAPLYTKKETTVGAYSVLSVTSASDEETESESKINEELEMENSQLGQKKNRNNRKKRKGKPANSVDVDEIDKLVGEVNAMLGTPPAVEQEPEKKSNPEIALFAVHQKHLDANDELRRTFGPESEEDERRRARQRNIKYQKNIVLPKAYTFSKAGLSMSIKSRDNDITYFTFDHNKDYKKMHQSFLDNVPSSRSNAISSVDDLLKDMHVEALLEFADIFFHTEDYNAADTIIERCIAYMQYVAHPCFTLTGRRCRLEYKYLENRAFHIVLLKYAHMLSNRACHRTALEIAKALLNLDPSDPLAVIFIIDTLALRAREHKWLFDAVEHWETTRQAEYLFNLQYSRAMCCFHLTKSKNKEIDIEEANKVMQECLLKFPYVLMKILEYSSQRLSEQLKNSYLFNAFASKTTSIVQQNLMNLYAKLTWSRWKEGPVMNWLLKNATELSIKFDTEQNIAIQELQTHFVWFRKCPAQIVRHLCIIKPMADLLVDGVVPAVPSYRSSDPAPPKVNFVNRYDYQTERRFNSGFIVEFLRSLPPLFDEND